MARIDVRPVQGLAGRRRFVDLPFRLHRNDPAWVPPLRMSVYDRISPRHPANATQRTQLWMAYVDGKPAGRIGACIDTTFDRLHDERWCWVGFYESVDDQGVASSLFDVALAWARGQGATECVGPASFTLNDECGLQVDNFDVTRKAMIAAGVNFIGDVQHAGGVSWQHFYCPDGTVLEISGPGDGATAPAIST